MSQKKETISRIGMVAKGAIYLLIGILTALPIFGLGGKTSSSKGALRFLADQSYGQVLLVILGLGLLGYLFFRGYQAIANLKNHDDNAKGYLMRGSYLVSGLVYGYLGFTALKMVFGSSSGKSSSVSKVLNSEYGNTIAIGIALVLVGKAIYEFYMAYSGKFKEEVEQAGIDHKARTLLTNAGTIGFTARGIVAGILAYLFFKAGLQNASGDLNRADAFNLLQNEFGSIIMAIVAAGIACYGVFMLIKSKYPDVDLR
jgi:hypothetical protein